MCGVIVVDVGRSRSTCLRRDANTHDHYLRYHHDYFLLCQFPNNNLSTHRMLFSREKPLVKTMPPGSTFIIYKILKIPYCNFTLFILFCIFVLSIYQLLRNLILQVTAKGLATPCSRWIASICCLCAGVVNVVLLGSPTGLITLILN